MGAVNCRSSWHHGQKTQKPQQTPPHSHLLLVPDVAKLYTIGCNAQEKTKSAINARKNIFKKRAKVRQCPREIQEDSEENFTGAVHVDNTDSDTIDAIQNPWVITVNLNKRPITFKVHTGADVTVVSDTDCNENKDGPLSTCNKKLSSPSREVLDVCGQFIGKLHRNSVSTT